MPGSTLPPSDRWKTWGIVALICGLVLLCYWPALPGGLVWDDLAHVTRPDLRSWAGLHRIWFDLHATQQYYPVLHSAFWIEHRLWGDATLGYHLTNALLHATACCLLALVLRRLWGPAPTVGSRPADPGASDRVPRGAEWLAAMVFAVHPVCIESVAWISEQKNTLALVFYLLAALVYLDFDAQRRRWSYGLALAFFLLALGTKSVTATLPAAILVVLWWRNGRLSLRRDAGPLIPWFLAALAAGLITVWVERTVVGAQGAKFDLSAGQRLLLAGRVIWFYLGKLAWPTDLMFIYPRWNVPAEAAGWYGWLGGALAVTVLFWLIRRRTRGPLAGWLFFAGSLLPALGFFNVYPFIFSYVADHFQYLASLGIIVPAATGLAVMLSGAPQWIRAGGRVLCALLVITLAVMARRQSALYRDGETLYRETLARNPSCWMAHNNLGLALSAIPGRTPEAISHYEAALRINPDLAEAQINLGLALSSMPGRLPEAISHYEAALRINPDLAEGHNLLGVALSSIPGRLPEAISHYETALRNRPNFAEAHHNLGVELSRSPGRLPEAISQFEAALRINPDLAGTHLSLGLALSEIPGRTPDAISQFEAALQIDPDLAEAHHALAFELAKSPDRRTEAIAHYEQALRLQPAWAEAHVDLAHELAKLPGRLPEALAHYEQALRLQPDFAEAHVYLAYELAKLPDRLPEARAHFEAALRLRPSYVEALNGLGIVLARQGQREEARKHWERALELKPDYKDARRNLDLLARLPEP
jgi:tetratricopeptide (TPR) repeat protein